MNFIDWYAADKSTEIIASLDDIVQQITSEKVGGGKSDNTDLVAINFYKMQFGSNISFIPTKHLLLPWTSLIFLKYDLIRFLPSHTSNSSLLSSSK